jgi:hypothetical protein
MHPFTVPLVTSRPFLPLEMLGRVMLPETLPEAAPCPKSFGRQIAGQISIMLQVRPSRLLMSRDDVDLNIVLLTSSQVLIH